MPARARGRQHAGHTQKPREVSARPSVKALGTRTQASWEDQLEHSLWPWEARAGGGATATGGDGASPT